jgi:leucyl-tRNA synthetase
MFPYLSGDLHVGHGRNYILGDVVVRLKTMQDTTSSRRWAGTRSGLPAENAATPTTSTRRWTAKHRPMKEQLSRASYTLNREIVTVDYYRWTQ